MHEFDDSLETRLALWECGPLILLSLALSSQIGCSTTRTVVFNAMLGGFSLSLGIKAMYRQFYFPFVNLWTVSQPNLLWSVGLKMKSISLNFQDASAPNLADKIFAHADIWSISCVHRACRYPTGHIPFLFPHLG